MLFSVRGIEGDWAAGRHGHRGNFSAQAGSQLGRRGGAGTPVKGAALLFWEAQQAGCTRTHIHPHMPQVPAQPRSTRPKVREQRQGLQWPRWHSRPQWRLRPNRDPSCYKRGNTFLFRVRCVHISMTKFVQSSQFKNEVSQQLVIPHIYSKIKVSTNPCRVVQK